MVLVGWIRRGDLAVPGQRYAGTLNLADLLKPAREGMQALGS
jgi:hypothetical protein